MDLGHEIGIHFDSTLYNDPALGFELEMNLFKLLTGVDSKVISFHRPNNFYLDNNDLFSDCHILTKINFLRYKIYLRFRWSIFL